MTKCSFASDLQIFHELDDIAGQSGCDSYKRADIITFLKSKGWMIEGLSDVVEELRSTSRPTISDPVPLNQHIIFHSTTSESGSDVPKMEVVPTEEGVIYLHILKLSIAHN